MLIKALKVYVRPILDYNSPVWSPSFVKNILLISLQKMYQGRTQDFRGG